MNFALDKFEGIFNPRLRAIPAELHERAGVLLPIVPEKRGWESFVAAIKADWLHFAARPDRWSACLIMLYAGTAFFNVGSEHGFWEGIARQVGRDELDQGELNRAYLTALNEFHLRYLAGQYVESAIFHIGVPIALWKHFLAQCEWAFKNTRWRSASPTEWRNLWEERLPAQPRIRRFFIDNPDAVRDMILEVIRAKQHLTDNPLLSPEELRSMTTLRREYFEECEETATFLRPEDPESLIERPRLAWDDSFQTLRLLLPGVAKANSEVRWSFLGQNVSATSTSTAIMLHSLPQQFEVALHGTEAPIKYLIRGFEPWALFDLANQGLWVGRRKSLPLREFAIISTEPVSIREDGMDVEHEVEPILIGSEQSKLYRTRIFPLKNLATAIVKSTAGQTTLTFQAGTVPEVGFLVGAGRSSGAFKRLPNGRTQLDHLPVPFAALPEGFFDDPVEQLQRYYTITLDNTVGNGEWRALHTKKDGKDVFVWERAQGAFFKQTGSGKTNDLQSLDQFFALRRYGERTITISSPFSKVDGLFDLIPKDSHWDMCSEKLPGEALLLFLLSQREFGLSWQEILIFKEIIEQGEHGHLRPMRDFEIYGDLKKYVAGGTVAFSNGRYKIVTNRATVQSVFFKGRKRLKVRYTGAPSAIWELTRTGILGAWPITARRDLDGTPPFLLFWINLGDRAEFETVCSDINVLIEEVK